MASYSLCSSSLVLLLFFILTSLVQTKTYPLDKICKRSKNPTFCYTHLRPASGSTLEVYEEIIIDTLVSHVSRTSTKIQSLLSKTKDPNVRAVYSLCLNYYSAAQSALDAASKKLIKRQFGDLDDAANTVVGDANACYKAFSLAPSQTLPIAYDNVELDLLSDVFLVISKVLAASS